MWLTTQGDIVVNDQLVYSAANTNNQLAVDPWQNFLLAVNTALYDDAIVSTAPLPSTIQCFADYAALPVVILANTTLRNLYILQQFVAAKAILARYKILRKADSLADFSLEHVFELAGIQPFPTALLDIYLSAEALLGYSSD